MASGADRKGQEVEKGREKHGGVSLRLLYCNHCKQTLAITFRGSLRSKGSNHLPISVALSSGVEKKDICEILEPG